MKAYKDCDEWMVEAFGGHDERRKWNIEQWVREAWKQATRTARVQEQILVTELRKVKKQLHDLEEEIEDWTMENKFNDTYENEND